MLPPGEDPKFGNVRPGRTEYPEGVHTQLIAYMKEGLLASSAIPHSTSYNNMIILFLKVEVRTPTGEEPKFGNIRLGRTGYPEGVHTQLIA